MTLAGLLLGTLEALFAPPLAGESTPARVTTLALLDGTLAGVLGLALGWLGAWSDRAPRRRLLWLAALGPALWLGLVLDRVAHTDVGAEALRAPLRLERALPRLASDHPRLLVLVTLDTVRADAALPALDARLDTGRRYPGARAAASWTLPSVASMLTGLDEVQHGAGQRASRRHTHARTPLGPVPTVAERLQDQGFVTVGVVSNPYLGAGHGLHRGFDRLFDVSRDAVVHFALRRALAGRLLLAPRDADASGVNRQVEALLSQLRDGRAFLWVHYTDPHAPYRDDGQHSLAPCETDCFDGWRAARRGEPVDRDAARQLYAAELARLDAGLAGLFATLAPLDPDVLVVGDHGEAFGPGEDVEHGHAFSDAVLRVPFGAWGPHVPPGTSDAPVDGRAVHDLLLALADGRWQEPVVTPLPMRSKLFGEPEQTCFVGDQVDPSCRPRPEPLADESPLVLGLEALGYVE